VQQMRARWAKPEALAGASLPPYVAPAPGDAENGAGVYQTFCAMCHGPGGRGGPVAGSIVNGSFLGLVPDQELRTIIIVGVPGTAMPNWRNHAPRPMSSQEISDVVAWLAAQRPQFPGQPYPSQAGRAGVSPALSSLSVTRPAATAGGTTALPGFGPATGGS